METELAVLCFSPVSRGGFGIIPAKLNESVELSAQAAAATRLKHVVCDAYWPNAAVALEYDGRESHGSASQQDRDSRRRNALVIDGVELTVVTSSRFHNVSGFASLADGLARSVGKPKRKRPSGHLAKHMELRRQIRRYHREHFPFQDG